ncbi:VWA domain-containing protein [Herbidospora mongoliensis]|uniref:VWA domain-containing protein n=1 Tax=Herbidospora mongoliensis TaxID=688067 RepID=UPI0008377199|nr:VWA domain-containing protein [Herbidospora mongoliensis]
MLIRVTLTLSLLAAGCTGPPQDDLSGPPFTLRVLAGDGLADMAPILRDAIPATGVTVALTTTDDPARFETAGRDFDAIWPASDHRLRLRGGTARLDGTVEIMSSPVIVGVSTRAAHRLGWDRRPATWADIAAAAASGRFTFGMADPARSDDGLNALVAAATALTGPGALQPGEEHRAAPRLAGLFTGQRLTANSTSWLVRTYRDGFGADGLIGSESEILSADATLPPEHRLIPIHPADGTVTADHPLSLLATSPAAKDAFQRLTRWLRTQPVQERIAGLTRRRPIVSGARVAVELSARQFQIPFPADLDTVDALVHAYNDNLRLPGRTVYVLDTSGSMKGARLARLKEALSGLTGTFRRRERITFLPFAMEPGAASTVDIPETGPTGGTLREIRTYVENLTAGGDTAIYDSLVRAYDLVGIGKGRIRSVVLLTDGENTSGRGFEAFARFHRGLPGAAPPVFAIVFGDADRAEMDRLAKLTSGAAFDATSSALSLIFQEIRGYQ